MGDLDLLKALISASKIIEINSEEITEAFRLAISLKNEGFVALLAKF
jgi:hypothetical protein